MNKAILIGRLTRDPELRYTSSGRAVCQFSIAINRTYTNQQGQRETDFINCVVWDKQAENLAKYVTKGRLVAVDGRIQTRNYDNNEGKKVYVTEVLANSIQFLESKNSVSGSGNDAMGQNPFDTMPEPTYPTPSTSNESVSVEKDPFESFGESIEISDNDLPF
jgi:single-strand DNA-binding protein